MKRYVVQLIKGFVIQLSVFCVVYLIEHMFFENAKKDITGYFGVFVGLFIVYAVRMKYKMDDESEEDEFQS